MTIRREPSNHIKRRAVELGMRTLRDSGWMRLKQGKTTFEEVVRVTAESDMV
jgi:type II secretory ATPase GspE/PulE/Tfp pilus assembly ATPase PilB-like protein